MGHKGRRWRRLFSLRSAVNPMGRRLGGVGFMSWRIAERMAAMACIMVSVQACGRRLLAS